MEIFFESKIFHTLFSLGSKPASNSIGIAENVHKAEEEEEEGLNGQIIADVNTFCHNLRRNHKNRSENRGDFGKSFF